MEKKIAAGMTALMLTLTWMPGVRAEDIAAPAGPAAPPGVITDVIPVPPGADPAVVSPAPTIPPQMLVQSMALNAPAAPPANQAVAPRMTPPANLQQLAADPDEEYIGSGTEFATDMLRIRNQSVSSAGAIIRNGIPGVHASYQGRLNRILNELTAGTMSPERARRLSQAIIDRCNLMRNEDNRLRPGNFLVNTNALTEALRIDTQIFNEAIRQRTPPNGNGAILMAQQTPPIPVAAPPSPPPGTAPGTGNKDILEGLRGELRGVRDQIEILLKTKALTGLTGLQEVLRLAMLKKREADIVFELVIRTPPQPSRDQALAARRTCLAAKIQANTEAINQLTVWIDNPRNITREELATMRAERGRLQQERGFFQNELDGRGGRPPAPH